MASSEGMNSRGERLDDADFSGARLHSPNLEGTRITDGWLRNADISGFIGGLRVNGIDVAPLVEAELDRRFPDRMKLRAVDPQGLAEAWALIEDVWRTTVARARTLPEASLFERVDDEWSFVETLRHLIFATDAWLLRMVRQLSHPYHPWGLAGSFLTDPASLGIDPEARPSLDDVLAVRRERSGDPLRMGGLLILPDAVHAPGRPYVHARLGSPRRTGGTPITVSACATL
jgi:DinB superfamily